MYNGLIFEKSSPGREGFVCPRRDVPYADPGEVIPQEYLAQSPPPLPEVSERDLIKHYTHLSNRNYNVDAQFYPLGSCTMKYNPKINEKISRLPGFANIHPLADADEVQGAIELLVNLEKLLCQITGMSGFTLQPAAGAHGEFTALLMIRAYFNAQGEPGENRHKILIPDSAHGTNPASAVMVGFETVEIKSDERGNVDLENLKSHLDDTTACLMLTMPNTLGLWDEHLDEIIKSVHKAGGLVYLDGANLNAFMGITRPADLGFDIMHTNLHKTFSTPHGGGGPGSGPVGCIAELVPYLPNPRPVFEDGKYRFINNFKSIGRVKSFFGNFGVMVKAYTYILSLGAEGIKQTSMMAVLNANYMKEKMKGTYYLKYDRPCLHEFVLSARNQKEKGVSAKDIAKRLLDYGHYAPTVYFPLIVEEALMVEPTETESLQTLDEFMEDMKKINEEVNTQPQLVLQAPHTTPVKRVDETLAARKPVLRWKP